jgi:hypothetical protein
LPSALVETAAPGPASTFCVFESSFFFFVPFRHVDTPLDTLRMTLPACTNAICTSSIDGRTSISGILNGEKANVFDSIESFHDGEHKLYFFENIPNGNQKVYFKDFFYFCYQGFKP